MTPTRVTRILGLLALGAALGVAPKPAEAVPVLFDSHYYDVIVVPQIAWAAANTAAQASTFMGASGHLATITSLAEDAFINSLRLVTPGINLTGTFNNSELWVGGFQAPGSPEPGSGWQWVTGEGLIPPTNAGPGYANWLIPEPNNAGGAENFLAVGLLNQFGWNDEANVGGVYGYVVEYEPVPEPATLTLLGTGLLGVALRRRRKA